MKSQSLKLKPIALFGSTGSIGKQTLEVLSAFPGEFKVVGLTALKNAELLAEQAESLRAQTLNTETLRVQTFLSPTPDQIASLVNQAEIVVNAVPGFDGLAISLATLRASTPANPKKLLSANKESLAIAGNWLVDLAQKTGAQIHPLDSEASAIWQLLSEHQKERNPITSLTLTCSGGPFWGRTRKELQKVSREEALAHPTWKMGPKVSLDSATLINKVLEVYEVHHLFKVPLSKIHILIHRQSQVHSMVHLKSKATRMHITQNDMRLFISYALHFPTQPVSPWPIFRAKKSTLDFAPPDEDTFLPLKWLRIHGGNPNFPIILNALNDIATAAFLRGELDFLGIYDFIEAELPKYLYEIPPQSVEEMISWHKKIMDRVPSLSLKF